MKLLLSAISPWSRGTSCYCAWGALIVLPLAVLPFLLDVLGRTIDWIIGVFRQSRPLWEETSWLR